MCFKKGVDIAMAFFDMIMNICPPAKALKMIKTGESLFLMIVKLDHIYQA